MKRKLLITCVLFTFFSAFLVAQTKGKVILVSQNQSTYEKLDASDKLYARSAFQSFVGNLTLLDEVTVRTEANDSSLRKIQKQSQIDAGKGLGSEDSAYASDQSSKADLRIEISLVKYKTGYKLEYTASNIETMEIVAGSSSEAYFALEQIDLETDKLSYAAMKALYGKGFISQIPYSVEVQLTHAEDTSDNYKKYILELTEQIDSSREELEKIRKENQTAEERAETLRKEQALQQKIQAAENARRKTEEQLRKYQEEIEKAAKQEAELKALAEQKRSDLAKKFQEKIRQSQEQQDTLNKELIQGLSLEKRIELIEADRQILSDLEAQLISSINGNTDYFDEKMNKEIDDIYAEPWRLAETDANGNPTEKARKYRDSKVKKIQDKYEKLKTESNNDLKTSYVTSINAYEKQIDEGIKDLEETQFVYRSFEKGSQVIVSVGNYDGEKCNWTVTPYFDMKETDLITNIPDLTLLQCTVSYKDIAGKEPVEYNGKNDSEYAEYMDAAELADLCFRTSTPYIYGILTLKVKYNSVYGDYRLVFNQFTLKRMEDNKIVANYTLDDYNSAVRGSLSVKNKTEKQKEKESQEAQKRQEKEERQKKQETQRQEQHVQAKGLLASIIDYWTPNMRQKAGYSFCASTDPFGLAGNVEVRINMSTDSIWYIPMTIGYDNFDQMDNFSFGIGIGTSVNFGCFRPYADLSIIGGILADSSSTSVKRSSSDDDLIGNLRLASRSGLDIVIGGVSLGMFVNSEVRFGEGNANFLRAYESVGISFGYYF